jgi:hypothetical protein
MLNSIIENKELRLTWEKIPEHKTKRTNIKMIFIIFILKSEACGCINKCIRITSTGR